jgi:hypothetical protein
MNHGCKCQNCLLFISNYGYYGSWTCVLFWSNVNYLYRSLLKSAFFTDLFMFYMHNQYHLLLGPQHMISSKYACVWVNTFTVRCGCILINTE